MKPMHHTVTRLNRCPCCQSKYSTRSVRKTNIGKTAARMKDKRNINKELGE